MLQRDDSAQLSNATLSNIFTFVADQTHVSSSVNYENFEAIFYGYA